MVADNTPGELLLQTDQLSSFPLVAVFEQVPLDLELREACFVESMLGRLGPVSVRPLLFVEVF